MKKEAIYLNDWKKSKLEGLLSDFYISADKLTGFNILLASYTYMHYEGNAYVLLERDGIYYEVNGSHCSCNGLEGQWIPEETSLSGLRHRAEKGSLGMSYDGNTFQKELLALLDELGEPTHFWELYATN